MKMIIKSLPNEIGAVLLLTIEEENFTLDYMYDSQTIKYDKIMSMKEIGSKINELRNNGIKENRFYWLERRSKLTDRVNLYMQAI